MISRQYQLWSGRSDRFNGRTEGRENSRIDQVVTRLIMIKIVKQRDKTVRSFSEISKTHSNLFYDPDLDLHQGA